MGQTVTDCIKAHWAQLSTLALTEITATMDGVSATRFGVWLNDYFTTNRTDFCDKVSQRVVYTGTSPTCPDPGTNPGCITFFVLDTSITAQDPAGIVSFLCSGDELIRVRNAL